MLKLPKLYAIVDRETLDKLGVSVRAFAEELREGGVRLVQYRDKKNGPQEVLRAAAEIAAVFEGIEATLILNDRADLAVLAGWGVHVGHRDLAPEDARRVVGAGCVVGVSTHNDAQVIAADAGEADYVAIGPVFATSTKVDAEPVVGLEGVRRARALTRRFPEGRALVAIGGITLENARSVIEAGADAVAVIGGLLGTGMPAGAVAREFLEILQ